MDADPSNWDFSCDFKADFGSSETASIAYSTLAVDKELQPDKVRREMSVSEGKIFVFAIPYFYPISLYSSCMKGEER